MDLRIQQAFTSDEDVKAYTLSLDDNEVLSAVTSSDIVVTDWMEGSKKLLDNTKKGNKIIVSLSVENINGVRPANKPYDLLVMSVGHLTCFLYQMPEMYKNSQKLPIGAPKLLKEFLESPKVIVVGVGIKKVAKTLRKVHGIKIYANNIFDLRDMAKKMYGILDQDIDGLSRSVLGKSLSMKNKINWYVGGRSWGHISPEKVMYATAESKFRTELPLFFSWPGRN
ncbi:uncharacterized protein [Rutidosis leptorrhynchoides]|uniref:uncharacterized protein n=1 Tax=Rutidosis leptorrhynchoides TaxID=125765 RepID=UPI003A9A440C